VSELPTPAEILRRAKPIPTYRTHPTTTPHDVIGVDPQGAAVRVSVLGRADPVLLLFLSAACLGCRDLWDGIAEVQRGLPAGTRLAVVARSPADEDPAVVGVLARPSVATGVPVVMSTRAYTDYRVGGPPFLVLVDRQRVRTEGVAWGIEETLRATLAALEG
jgi:hypothetical protein